jgi:tRNA modification GTPase
LHAIDTTGPHATDSQLLNNSTKTGAGTDALKNAIRRIAGYKDLGEGAYTARSRQFDALANAARHLITGRCALESAKTGELFDEELRLSHEALGEITGTIDNDDLADKN